MPECNMRVNPEHSPEGEHTEDVSSAEVPAYHYRSVLDDDDDEDVNEIGHESDSDDDNGYELLPQGGGGEEDGHATYYQHHVMVDWVEENGSEVANGHDENKEKETDACGELTTKEEKVEEKSVAIMSEEHIEKIKSAMEGFELPNDNIPQWAKVVGEDGWKSLLESKIEERKKSRSESGSLSD